MVQFRLNISILDGPDTLGGPAGVNDFVYILSATEPAVPTGGTTVETHTPTGWQRTEPNPTTTQNVYRARRERTYADGMFQSATAWGDVIKIADLLIILTIDSFTINGGSSATIDFGETVTLSWMTTGAVTVTITES